MPRKGRVIVLSDYAGGEGTTSGGAGHAVLDSFQALRGAGIDADLVTGFGIPNGDPARTRPLGGDDLREGGAIDALRAIYNPASRAALKRVLATADPDATVVILHQWTRYLSPSAIGLLAPFRTMIYLHDHFWPCPNGAYYDFPTARPCHRRPMGLACVLADCDRGGRALKAGRLARHVVLRATTSKPTARRLFLHLSTRARATAAPLMPGEQHAEITNWLDVPAAPPRPARPRYDFGYLGRLEPEKGVGDLVEAAVAEGLSGLFVGAGSVERAIRTAPGQTLEAWRPRAAVADAMRECRVVVLPSRWPETWGLTTAQAMAARTPVLVSTRAGSADLVERFGGGAVFDPDVPGDLAAKLALVVRAGAAVDPDRWPAFVRHLSPRRHAERIAALAREHWDIELMPAPPPAGSGWQPDVRPPPPR